MTLTCSASDETVPEHMHPMRHNRAGRAECVRLPHAARLTHTHTHTHRGRRPRTPDHHTWYLPAQIQAEAPVLAVSPAAGARWHQRPGAARAGVLCHCHFCLAACLHCNSLCTSPSSGKWDSPRSMQQTAQGASESWGPDVDLFAHSCSDFACVRQSQRLPGEYALRATPISPSLGDAASCCAGCAWPAAAQCQRHKLCVRVHNKGQRDSSDPGWSSEASPDPGCACLTLPALEE